MDPFPFPEVIDSTLVATIKACEIKAARMYGQDWKPTDESVHLIAGGAFARGLEVARRSFWDDQLNAEDSLGYGLSALVAAYGDFQPPEHGSGSAKTLDRMCGAFEFYYDQFPLVRRDDPATVMMEQHDGFPAPINDGKHAIEFSFAEPLPINHPVTGEPLIYAGRADMIADYAGGLYVWDDKTATQLGQRWGEQWDLRSQFTGYTWAARRAGFNVKGVIANGVSILKTKYDKARAITHRSQWEIDRWEENVCLVLERFIQAWKANRYIYNLDDSCTSYGGCPLRVVCKGEVPEEWLPMYFTKRHWDPLTRTETEIPA
jgi:hypothetical protein